jgi:hypothetical protein
VELSTIIFRLLPFDSVSIVYVVLEATAEETMSGIVHIRWCIPRSRRPLGRPHALLLTVATSSSSRVKPSGPGRDADQVTPIYVRAATCTRACPIR